MRVQGVCARADHLLLGLNELEALLSPWWRGWCVYMHASMPICASHMECACGTHEFINTLKA